jgi:penicillin-binding protein A
MRRKHAPSKLAWTISALLLVGSSARRGAADEPSERPRRAPSWLREIDPRAYREEDGALVAPAPEGGSALLSMDPGLQHAMEAVFARYEVPYGGLVAMDPRSGRVLAYVSHSSAEAAAPDQVQTARAPAASVFKLVTSAALLDSGVGPNQRTCYHGGASGLTLSHLTDDPRRDTACATLEDALGGSINGIFAKLADRHLEQGTLARYAAAFGFGEALPVDVGAEVSAVDVPSERLEFARTAAGFYHSHLSPLHGALLASTVASHGRMPAAWVVDQVHDRQGGVRYEHQSRVHREVIGRLTAQSLNRMMQRTVSHGTARRAFVDDHGVPFLPGIRVAGKTGTLFSERPFRGYTWWVGFAPAERPTIAVSALVVNRPEWRIKASFVAREALRHWLVTRARSR